MVPSQQGSSILKFYSCGIYIPNFILVKVLFSSIISVQNRAGLRHFLDSFAGSDYSAPSQAKTLPDSKSNNSTVVDSSSSGQIQTVTEMRLVDLLDSTLWNRKLAPSSERLVCALVHQIFHGIKEHFLVSTELKVGVLFNLLCISF
jgi:hypothetical protein